MSVNSHKRTSSSFLWAHGFNTMPYTRMASKRSQLKICCRGVGNMNLRKTMIIKETIESDGFGKACDPITRVVAVAVIQNPFAGRFVEDLSPLFDIGG